MRQYDNNRNALTYRSRRKHSWSAIVAILGAGLVVAGSLLPWWSREDGAEISIGNVVSISQQISGDDDVIASVDAATLITWYWALAAIAVVIGVTLFMARRAVVLRRVLLLTVSGIGLYVTGFLYTLPTLLRNRVDANTSIWDQYLHRLKDDAVQSIVGSLQPDIGLYVLGLGTVAVGVAAIIPSSQTTVPILNVSDLPSSDVATQLRELSALFDAGSISSAEFAAAKSQLLGADAPTNDPS